MIKSVQFKSVVATLKTKQSFRFFVVWVTCFCALMSSFLNSVLHNFSYIEIFPKEFIFPTGMHAFTALLVALVIFWLPWLKSFAARLFSAVILALLLVGYDASLQAISGLLRAFTPGLTETDPLAWVSIMYVALLIALAVFLGIGLERAIAKVKHVQPRDVVFGIVVLVAYLFVIPAFTVGSMIPTLVRQSSVQAQEIAKPQAASAQDKPDIYYIVLDRYTNNEVLKTQFNYDNSDFTDFLKTNDFTVNKNAYANYPYTTMSVSSTLNAQYTNQLIAPFKNDDVQSRTLYHNLIWQSSVVKALKKEGYQYHAIGSWYGATYKVPLANRDYMNQPTLNVFGADKKLRGIEDNEFTKSLYHRFAALPSMPWWPIKYEDGDHISDVRQQLNTLDDLSTTGQPGGRFIFAHILVPHDPFVFNADGSLSQHPSKDSNGAPIKSKYLGQVQFISSQMKTLIANIQKQSDGKAVVILNADEGPYPQFQNDTFKKPLATNATDIDEVLKGEDMRNWSDDYLKMKFGILQAVHIPKATQDDLQHLSSVNMFKIVLNRYFGYELNYLPQCQFGLTSGSQNEFNYADITQRFNPDVGETCKQYESLPD